MRKRDSKGRFVVEEKKEKPPRAARKRDDLGRFVIEGKYKKYVRTELVDNAFLDAFEMATRAAKDRKPLSASQCLTRWKKDNLK